MKHLPPLVQHLTGQLLKRIGVACSLQVFRAIEATFAYQPRIPSQGDWEDDFPLPKVGYVNSLYKRYTPALKPQVCFFLMASSPLTSLVI